MNIFAYEINFKKYGLQGYAIKFEKIVEEKSPIEISKSPETINKNRFFTLRYEMNSQTYNGDIMEGKIIIIKQ